MTTELITVSEVFNLGGIDYNGRKYREGDFWTTCPECTLRQTFWHARKEPSEDPRVITQYKCRDCGGNLVAVVHWGVQEQPVPNPVYRIGDYAIDNPVGFEIPPDPRNG